MLDRRAFLKRLGLLAALPLAPRPASCQEAVVDRPSFLLVVVDDMPFRMMDEMPSAKAALSQGVDMTRAYVTTPQCGPSRATVLTGKYVHNLRGNGLTNDHTLKRFKEGGWTRDNLAPNLAAQGYRCGLFGKYMNGFEEMPGFVAPGFTDWKCSFRVKNQIRANSNGRLVRPNVGQARETGWLVQSAEAFMDKANADGVPFLCVLSFNSPHAPYAPTPASRDHYAGVPLWRGAPPENFDHHDPNKPRWLNRISGSPLTNAQRLSITQEWRGKAAETRDVDNSLGPLLEGLDYDTTYAAFMTDNGYLHGEHGARQKNLPYEESSRTPFFWRGPGLMQNATSDALAGSVDVAPTLYEAAGLQELADSCDGRSLLGPLVGAEGYEWRDSLLLERYPDVGIPGWRAVRTEEKMYVEWDAGDRELYDMDADPFQKSNAAGAAPEQDAGLARLLGSLRESGGESMRAAETV